MIGKNKIWTDLDFKSMDWHDCHIYTISFLNDEIDLKNKICFDIDYIIECREAGKYFEFLISPCTLTFIDVFNLQINIDTGLLSSFNLEIDSINKLERINNRDGIFKWHIELQNGDIYFEASGFEQMARHSPIVSDRPKLKYDQRKE